MAAPESNAGPIRARKIPREDAQPKSVLERQASLSAYFIHRAERRRHRFLQRARTTTMLQEFVRALYLTGCLLFDFLVIPEPIFLWPGDVGWTVAGIGFIVAVAAEVWFYGKHFALKDEPSEQS